jgi:Protein of unknown function (DUF3592)
MDQSQSNQDVSAQPEGASQRKQVLLVAAPLMLIGFALLAYGVVSFISLSKVPTWPIVPAVVNRLELGGDEGLFVEYDYTVDGVLHHGSTWAYGISYGTYRSTNELAFRKLKNAKSVRTRYNPGQPSEACLASISSQLILSKFGFGLLFIVVPGGMILLDCFTSQRRRLFTLILLMFVVFVSIVFIGATLTEPDHELVETMLTG